MQCHRCGAELDADLAAKYRILREIFGEPWNPKWDECYTCHDRPWARFKRFLSNLVDPIWWEYHSRYEIPTWFGFKRKAP